MTKILSEQEMHPTEGSIASLQRQPSCRMDIFNAIFTVWYGRLNFSTVGDTQYCCDKDTGCKQTILSPPLLFCPYENFANWQVDNGNRHVCFLVVVTDRWQKIKTVFWIKNPTIGGGGNLDWVPIPCTPRKRSVHYISTRFFYSLVLMEIRENSF